MATKKNKKIIGGILVAAGLGTGLYLLLRKKKLTGSVIVDDVEHVGPVDDSDTNTTVVDNWQSTGPVLTRPTVVKWATGLGVGSVRYPSHV